MYQFNCEYMYNKVDNIHKSITLNLLNNLRNSIDITACIAMRENRISIHNTYTRLSLQNTILIKVYKWNHYVCQRITESTLQHASTANNLCRTPKRILLLLLITRKMCVRAEPKQFGGNLFRQSRMCLAGTDKQD